MDPNIFLFSENIICLKLFLKAVNKLLTSFDSSKLQENQKKLARKWGKL